MSRRDELWDANQEVIAVQAAKLGIRRGSELWDEMESVGRVALLQAAEREAGRDDDPQDRAPFAAFAHRFVRWRMIDALRVEGRHKILSLDDVDPVTEGNLHDQVADRRAAEPCACAEANELKEQIVAKGGVLSIQRARQQTPPPNDVLGWQQRFREAAFKALQPTDMTELMRALHAKALAGDLNAAKFLLTFLCGAGRPVINNVNVLNANDYTGGGEN